MTTIPTDQDAPRQAAGRAGRREWIGLAVIALPCMLYSMDLTVLHLAVPALTRELAPSSTQLLWIIDIYGFLVAGSLITAGTLGDRVGRRRLLLIGAGLFAAASVLAALSTSAEMLIVTRALLGIAGATVAPSTLSLIRNMFSDPAQRTTAISIWVTSFSVGAAVGPLIGGVLLEFFWWGSVFLIAVPVMVLLLIVGPRLLPEYRDPHAGRLDLASAAMSISAVLAVIYGLKRIAESGIAAVSLMLITAGLATGVLFVRRQKSLADPLIDIRLFHVPAFSASVATYGLTILILFGGFLFLPQYLQLVLGHSPLVAGVWTLPWSLAFVAGSMATPRLARRFRPATLMSAGLALSAIGYLMIAGLNASTGFAWFAIATLILSIGVAPVFTLTTDLIIGAAAPERAGAASAISETSAELGGALGIAIFGSIGVAAYRALMPELPPGLPPDVRTAASATLGGAIEVAGQMSGPAAEALLATARDAFVRGLRICAVIGTVGSVFLAGFALATLRRSGDSSDPVDSRSAPGSERDGRPDRTVEIPAPCATT